MIETDRLIAPEAGAQHGGGSRPRRSLEAEPERIEAEAPRPRAAGDADQPGPLSTSGALRVHTRRHHVLCVPLASYTRAPASNRRAPASASRASASC